MCHHANSHASCCSHSGLSRRGFLAVAGASAVSSYLLRPASAAETLQNVDPGPESQWPEVRVVMVRPKEKYWLGWPGTSWENKAYPDFLKSSRATLEKWGKELKLRITFLPEPLYDDAAVEKFAAALTADKPKGVVIVPLFLGDWGKVDKLVAAGVPAIIFSGLGTCFTGHIQQRSRLPGVHLISSPEWDLKPVRFGLKMIRCNDDIRRMRIARLIGNETRDEVLEPIGLRIRNLPRDLFGDTLKAMGETPEVKATYNEYMQAAKKRVEPSEQDVMNAARVYHVALKIMKEHECNGITMDCLGAVYARNIPTPPCMAWSCLLDQGIPAICEADMDAVMSHTLCCKLLDKPGFQQDPVPETVHNTFIGAHCVSPTRLNGYDQPREPFCLRSHSESDIGVSVQVLFKEGQPITVMQMTGPGRMILGRGQVLRNFDTPPNGGCRTSVELAMEWPPDTRDVEGFHQLFIYGDHVRDFQAYGQLYGIATSRLWEPPAPKA
jgi:hypothetical protein